MKSIYVLYLCFFTFCGVSATSATQAQTAIGVFKGAKSAVHPEWFKESFLDLEEDIADAALEDKRLMVYFWQPGCPYCAELISNNLEIDEIKQKLQTKFDVVALNMWGDREVIQVGGKAFTEKTLAAALNVNYTPTLLFFTESRKIALRLDGYVAPERFSLALDYVSGKHEKEYGFGQFVTESLAQTTSPSQTGDLIREGFFAEDNNDLQKLINQSNSPIAVYFEKTDCDDCRNLHQNILINKETRTLAEQLPSIQIDIESEDALITPSGTKLTVKEWVQNLDIHYTPTIVFYTNDGLEILRMDSMLKNFHVQSIFDYVSSEAYLHEPSFQRFISERADRKILTGEDVNIWSD